MHFSPNAHPTAHLEYTSHLVCLSWHRSSTLSVSFGRDISCLPHNYINMMSCCLPRNPVNLFRYSCASIATSTSSTVPAPRPHLPLLLSVHFRSHISHFCCLYSTATSAFSQPLQPLLLSLRHSHISLGLLSCSMLDQFFPLSINQITDGFKLYLTSSTSPWVWEGMLLILEYLPQFSISLEIMHIFYFNCVYI